ncbi:MAG TPA: hypothetical protein VH497_15770 [Vicinamibacterales bacterium]|jgi:hypothetical protein
MAKPLSILRTDDDEQDRLKSEPEDQRPRRRGTTEEEQEDNRSMSGGSNEGRSRHAGSRDVTEGTTGGAGTETGGTRNYRTGSGATGGDIGNRPE